MTTFATMFSEVSDIHLTKDVGMIPYYMHKIYGMEGIIITEKNGEYESLTKSVNGLKIEFIKRYFHKKMLDGIIYLIKKSKKIDILNVYHLSYRTFAWIYVYKFLNRKGKVYLKLDAGNSIKNIKLNHIYKSALKKCDLISIETKSNCREVNKIWPVKVNYIPNGFYEIGIKSGYEKKENIICTVGRIGAKEKATEILMLAFSICQKSIEGWKLKLIGPIEEEFKSYIEEYFKKFPELKGKVEFVGNIEEKGKLEEEYAKAKIFCLTSRRESFGIVLVEAANAGCYIVSTNLDSAVDVTDNGKYGDLFEIDNKTQLSELLTKICKNEEKIKSNFDAIKKYNYEHFSWNKICGDIYRYLS